MRGTMFKPVCITVVDFLVSRINPITNATTVLARVDMKHKEWNRGWAWMDVDRYVHENTKVHIYTKIHNTCPPLTLDRH